MMKNNDSKKVNPPYIPWETFKNFLKTLNSSAVPNRIDSSMMPPTMSGFNKAGVTSALKFFSLIDSEGEAQSTLKEIVDAFETKEWPSVIKNVLIPAYDDIVGDLKIDTATRKQLEEKFSEATQQMRDRFIRFYIPMLQEAGETVSPYLTQRQKRQRKIGPRKTQKKQKGDKAKEDKIDDTTKQTPASSIPKGMFRLPIVAISPDSFIQVPEKITPAQSDVVKAAADYLAVMARQNKESK